MQGHLQYLQRKQIDTDKWDRCIDAAANGLIYGYSWYLDAMARNWDALVWNDYEAVMPLTWNRKWGIKYLYQPAFTQQLGIFSALEISPSLEQSFLNELSSRFRFAEIFLNYGHPVGSVPRSNFILPLNGDYEAHYKKDMLKNLKRSAQFDLRYDASIRAPLILDAYQELYGARTPHIIKEDADRFKNMCMANQEYVVTRGVTENDQLLCAALLLRDANRLYLLHSVTWPAGRIKEANHFLLDRIIHEFAGSNLILDFEGSDIPGIATFYKKFGSIDQPYYFYRYNHLPTVVKWLKR